MCAIVATALTAIGKAATTALSAIGGGSKIVGLGKVASGAGSVLNSVRENRVQRFEEAVERNRSIETRNQARLAEQEAERRIVLRQRDARQLAGLRSAIVGASNIEQQSGSALLVSIGDARDSELETQIIQQAAGRRAQLLRYEADLRESALKLQRRNRRLGNVSSLLSQAGAALQTIR